MKLREYRELLFQAFCFETEKGHRVRCCHKKCGRLLKFEEMTMEHIIPKSLNGAVGHSSNLAPACHPCNHKRGNRPVELVIDEMAQEKLGVMIKAFKRSYYQGLKARAKQKREMFMGKDELRSQRPKIHPPSLTLNTTSKTTTICPDKHK